VSAERVRSLLLVALGGTAAWLWASRDALNYVRPSLTPYLLAGAAVLVLLGLLPPLGLLRRQPGAAEEGATGAGDPAVREGAGGHRAAETGSAGAGHGHGVGVGWLLLVPVLVVVLVQPAALGSHAVSGRAAVPGGGDGIYPALAPPVRGAVPMSMAEFVTRALRDRGRSLDGVRVRLVGFVAPGRNGEAYRLTRFVVFCCAADAEALQVVVQGDSSRRAEDQWLEVEGRWLPRPMPAADDPSPPPPVLVVDSIRPIAAQRPPYEYSLQYGG
jgi:uncharacterized repeat protein (TIGR03943 family)